MDKNVKSKFNKLSIGLVSGILIPIISILIFYFVNKYRFGSFERFVRHFVVYHLTSHLVSLSVIPNMAVFYLFIKKNFLYSAKGVVLATLIYGVVIVILRFFV